jgi:septum site-determining protein MinC
LAKLDIKGINKSLVFFFHSGTAEEYQAIIKEKLTANPRLFAGSPIQFQGEGLQALQPEEIIALQRLCLDHNMYFVNLPPSKPAPRQAAPRVIRGEASPAEDLILQCTLRSGQRAHSDGSIIIWGDVHESAEVTAGKDVIILGKLEGIAHAGCYGDINSLIFALSLRPRQLRIGDRISRSSGETIANNVPEIAYVSENNICIKEYSSKDPLLK